MLLTAFGLRHELDDFRYSLGLVYWPGYWLFCLT